MNYLQRLSLVSNFAAVLHPKHSQTDDLSLSSVWMAKCKKTRGPPRKPMAKCKKTRGPPRKPGSALKTRCAWKKCKRVADVKNISKHLTLSIRQVDRSQLRANLSPKCQAVKFCCLQHKKTCQLPNASKNPRGPREAMNPTQVTHLFRVFLHDGCPWAAVAMLLQMFLGDRCQLTTEIKWNWFSDLEPTSLKVPMVDIKTINKKTKARKIPLFRPFAKLLWSWAQSTPLQGRNGSTWPYHGRHLVGDDLLFPGYSSDGLTRDFHKPVTTQAYLERFRRAAGIIQNERKELEAGMDHPFLDFDLQRLGTHSMKKTSVTVLSSAGIPFSIISSITGTSVKTLQSTYDVPTVSRQSTAFQQPCAEMVHEVAASASTASKSPVSPESMTRRVKFCGWCGEKITRNGHSFCTESGNTLE